MRKIYKSYKREGFISLWHKPTIWYFIYRPQHIFLRFLAGNYPKFYLKIYKRFRRFMHVMGWIHNVVENKRRLKKQKAYQLKTKHVQNNHSHKES